MNGTKLNKNLKKQNAQSLLGVNMSNKGKSKETDDIDRAHWSDSMRKCLTDICLEQVKDGGRPGVQFSSKAWKMIIENFTQRTRHGFN